MEPFQKLKVDHDHVQELFRKFEHARSAAKRFDYFQEIRTELERHTQLEEAVVYPALRKHSEAEELILEANEEHHVVKVLLKELGGLKAEDPVFEAKMAVLHENIEHHIEEEEKEMFKVGKKVLSADEQKALAEAIQAHATAPASAGRS